MKKIKIFSGFILVLATLSLTSCYKLQTDYTYVPSTLDPHVNMTAKDYILSRGTNGVGSDTIFKWMQLGIEYAGIDWSEFEKPGRTYILLYNSAIRTLTSGKTTAGFFFDYPIVAKDPSGNTIKSKIDPTMDSTRPALYWTDYPQSFVKNYLLYMIIQGEYGFDNLGVNNTTVQTLLPSGATASNKDSKLSWVVTKTTPNPDVTQSTNITFVNNGAGGTGFDPEGKMNLKIGNTENYPIIINDRTSDRTAGFYFTNGRGHVFASTVHPFRYSWQ